MRTVQIKDLEVEAFSLWVHTTMIDPNTTEKTKERRRSSFSEILLNWN